MPADRNLISIPTLLGHESGLRRMIADATGRPYRAFQTLAEAQADPEGTVVFEGDDGGQIYLVCTAAVVRCSEEDLCRLLRDIDSLEWNDAMSCRVYFEALPVGSGVWGGMGGGRVVNGLWVHPRLEQYEGAIQEVLGGRRPCLKLTKP